MTKNDPNADPNSVTTSAGAGSQTVEVEPDAAAASQSAAAKPESKPDGGQEQGKQPAAAPEKYSLKLPADTLLDEGAIARTEAYAKARGLTNDQAQALLERSHEEVEGFLSIQEEAFEKRSKGWMDQIRSDKEMGGERFNESVALANRALVKFAAKEFVKELKETGLGNHPELFRAFYRVGLAMSEDTLGASGTQPGSAPRKKDVAELLYGEGTEVKKHAGEPTSATGGQ